MGLLIIDDQLAAVGVSNSIAVAVEQGDFGAGRYLVLGQGGGQLRQRQVGTYDGVGAAAAGERRADVVGRKEDVGLGGDLLLADVGPVEPGAGARVIGFLRIIQAPDLVQRRVIEQGL